MGHFMMSNNHRFASEKGFILYNLYATQYYFEKKVECYMYVAYIRKLHKNIMIIKKCHALYFISI